LFLLLAVVLLHFAQLDDLAHDLGVEAGRLGLGEDLADVGCERRLLLLQALDALDERLETLRRNAADIGHVTAPRRGEIRTFGPPGPAPAGAQT
jgi:hypothetical protein